MCVWLPILLALEATSSTDGSLQTYSKRKLARASEGQEWRRFFHQRARRQARPAPIEVCTARPCPRPRTTRANARPNDGQRLRVGTLFLIGARGTLVRAQPRAIRRTKHRNAGPVHSRRVRGFCVSRRVFWVGTWVACNQIAVEGPSGRRTIEIQRANSAHRSPQYLKVPRAVLPSTTTTAAAQAPARGP